LVQIQEGQPNNASAGVNGGITHCE